MIMIDHGSHLTVSDYTDDWLELIVESYTLPNPKHRQLSRQMASARRYGNKRQMFKLAKALEHTPKTVTYADVDNMGKLVLPVAAGIGRSAWPLWPVPIEVDYDLKCELRLYQAATLADATRTRHAVIEAPTGSGKTVMGVAAIAQRRTTAAVIVPTGLIQRQWALACHKWLGIMPKLLGGKDDSGDCNSPICIAIVNSAVKYHEQLEGYDHIIVDECHRVASPKLYDLMLKLPGKYRLGLSATPWRRDGLTDVIFWTLGRPVKVNRASLVACGALLAVDFRQVGTDFTTSLDAAHYFSDVKTELALHHDRNAQIAHMAADASNDGVCIVLCGRVDHCELLGKMFRDAVVLHGQQRKAERAKAMEAIEGGARIIIATSDLVGEGFDLPSAQTLILTDPMRFDGRVIQRIGRVVRPSPGQDKGIVIDLCDWKVPQLAAQAVARRRVYETIRREQ